MHGVHAFGPAARGAIADSGQYKVRRGGYSSWVLRDEGVDDR